MNLFRFLVFIISLLTFFTACKKESPSAYFSVTPEKTNNVNTLFQFNDCSSNASRHEWNFGDGNSSNISSPSHTYKTKGLYNVKLTIFNDDNEKDEKESWITIGDYFLVSAKINDIRFCNNNCIEYDSCIAYAITPGTPYCLEDDLPIQVNNYIHENIKVFLWEHCPIGTNGAFLFMKPERAPRPSEQAIYKNLYFSSEDGNCEAWADLTYELRVP